MDLCQPSNRKREIKKYVIEYIENYLCALPIDQYVF